MTDFAIGLRNRLVADTAVSAVVGTRVYWDIVPQTATLPYVVLTIVSDPRPEHLKGYQSARVTRVQTDCYAASFGAAKQLGSKIVQAVAQPWSTAGGRFGRVKCQGPWSGAGFDGPDGHTHQHIVDMLAEHTFAD